MLSGVIFSSSLRNYHMLVIGLGSVYLLKIRCGVWLMVFLSGYKSKGTALVLSAYRCICIFV